LLNKISELKIQVEQLTDKLSSETQELEMLLIEERRLKTYAEQQFAIKEK